MKRFSQQLKKKSESIRMRASEKRELRDRLVSYMEYHPMNANVTVHKKAAPVISEPFKIISFNIRYIQSFAGVFALFLIVGVPLIAEKSMPGDVLYPVKIQFNEELRSNLARSPYAKVEWETSRLERRIAEARLLADEGKLTQEIQQKVAIAVKEHSDAAQQGIAELRESDSDEAAIAEITFASALAVQSEVLEGEVNLANETDANAEGHSVVALANIVAEARTNAEKAQTNTPPSFEKLLGRVELMTTQAHELFSSVRVDASAEEKADIERRLSDIQRKVAEAIEIHDNAMLPVEDVTTLSARSMETPTSTEEGDATATMMMVASEPEFAPDALTDEEETLKTIELLRAALTDTQKLVSFMTRIEVRENVTIEELVPVSLTDEEQMEAIAAHIIEVQALQRKIDTQVAAPHLAEKVTYGKTELAKTIIAANATLNNKDFIQAKAMTVAAEALANDLLKLLENAESTKPEDTEKKASTTAPDVIDDEEEVGEGV